MALWQFELLRAPAWVRGLYLKWFPPMTWNYANGLGFLLCGAIGCVAIVAAGARGEPPENPDLPSRADIAAVFRFRVNEPMVLTIDFTNESTRPLGYLPDFDDRSVAWVEFSLTLDGVEMMNREDGSAPLCFRERVRYIKPGGAVRHELNLTKACPKLKPGRYKLRVRYQTSSSLERDFGIANVDIQRVVAWIEITAGK